MKTLAIALTLLFGGAIGVQAQPPDHTALRVEAIPLGDGAEGVVTSLTFRYVVPSSVAPDAELVLSGSLSRDGSVLRTFRQPLRVDERQAARLLITVPAGMVQLDARLIVDGGSTPVLLSKLSSSLQISSPGKPYVAGVDDGAEGIVEEGVAAERSGSLRIQPPRRDLAPNLFIVEVDADPLVKRVEFYVAEKKIFTRNSRPFRAELDLGAIPKRVEIRVVGYDASGRYVDADSWIVNERENPLEVKITRTRTPDGITHVKLTVQNGRSTALKSVELFANDRKLKTWDGPPYRIDLEPAVLTGAEFLRATVIDESGLEASDLVFMDGRRFTESIEVNLVELPVTVLDERGAAIVDLKEASFQVLEDGKPQKISDFAFSADLPLSIGVLVDHSGSMKPRIEEARKAAIGFFEQILSSRDQAFFGGFSWQTSRSSAMVSDVASLKRQVSDMPDADGGTALYDAIISGLYQFRGIEGRKALLIVTDGEDTVSRVEYDRMLEYVRSARVPLYFIGIGVSPLVGGGKLKALAAETGGIAYFIGKVEELKETYAALEKELRSQYLIGYYTQGGADSDKYRLVEVKTDRQGARVRTIRGFLP